MRFTIDIEKIDNGVIVSSHPSPTDRDPLGQRGGPDTRAYAPDADAALHLISIICAGAINIELAR